MNDFERDREIKQLYCQFIQDALSVDYFTDAHLSELSVTELDRAITYLIAQYQAENDS